MTDSHSNFFVVGFKLKGDTKMNKTNAFHGTQTDGKGREVYVRALPELSPASSFYLARCFLKLSMEGSNFDCDGN